MKSPNSFILFQTGKVLGVSFILSKFFLYIYLDSRPFKLFLAFSFFNPAGQFDHFGTAREPSPLIPPPLGGQGAEVGEGEGMISRHPQVTGHVLVITAVTILEQSNNQPH